MIIQSDPQHAYYLNNQRHENTVWADHIIGVPILILLQLFKTEEGVDAKI